MDQSRKLYDTLHDNGHIKENALSNLLTEETGRIHSTDGGNKTKVDIFCDVLGRYYSQKSCSGKNTQVHLTSTNIWCDYFFFYCFRYFTI